MAAEDGDPDVDRLQVTRALDDEADTERHDDLRHDRDVERATGVARTLKTAGISQGRRDENTGDAEHVQELCRDPDDYGVVHTEDREQLSGEEEETSADQHRARSADPRGHIDGVLRTVRLTGAEILPGNRRRSTHESERSPSH